MLIAPAIKRFARVPAGDLDDHSATLRPDRRSRNVAHLRFRTRIVNLHRSIFASPLARRRWLTPDALLFVTGPVRPLR